MIVARIAYVDYNNSRLKYAYQDGAGWHTETVAELGELSDSISIALWAGEQPCIGYTEKYDLRYAYRDAGGIWHTEIKSLASGHSVTTSCMALDGNGYPHFAYHDYYPYDDLARGYKDGDGWHLETVDSGTDTGLYPSIAVDGGGGIHVSYYSFYLNRMRYAYKNGVWSLETPENSIAGGAFPSIAIDSIWYPHIIWRQATPYHLKYTYRDAGGWHTETAISAATFPGSPHGIALDTANRPHIAYSNYAGNYELCYAYRDTGGVWHPEIADEEDTDFYCLYPAIALADGYPYIAYLYYDPITHDGVLKFAYKDGDGWHREVVDDTSDTGWVPSIALGALSTRKPQVFFM